MYLIKTIPKEFRVSKDSPEISKEAKETRDLLKALLPNGCRISNFPELLEKSYGVKFELFDPKGWADERFISYLMDLQLSLQKGEEIDLSQLHRDLLKTYQFTMDEKKMFLRYPLEDRLWGIWLAILNI